MEVSIGENLCVLGIGCDDAGGVVKVSNNDPTLSVPLPPALWVARVDLQNWTRGRQNQHWLLTHELRVAMSTCCGSEMLLDGVNDVLKNKK